MKAISFGMCNRLKRSRGSFGGARIEVGRSQDLEVKSEYFGSDERV